MKLTRARIVLLVAGLTAPACTGAMTDPSGSVASEQQTVAMTSTTQGSNASTERDVPPFDRPPIDREAPAAFRTATFALG